LIRYLHLLLFLGAVLLFSCKSQREAVQIDRQLKKKKTSALVSQIKAQEFKTDLLSIKTNVAFKTEKLSDSFKMYIRLKQDSVIWVSATYYRVEVARLLLTPDSVKILDRKEKKYYSGDFQVLNINFETDFNFYTLQDLILGNSSSLLDGKLKIKNDKRYYILNTSKKFKDVKEMKVTQIEKELINVDEGGETFNINYSLYYNPTNYHLERLMAKETKNDKSIFVKYSNFKELNGQQFPHDILYNVVSDKLMKLNVSYMKVEEQESLKYPFNISDKYEKVVY